MSQSRPGSSGGPSEDKVNGTSRPGSSGSGGSSGDVWKTYRSGPGVGPSSGEASKGVSRPGSSGATVGDAANAMPTSRPGTSGGPAGDASKGTSRPGSSGAAVNGASRPSSSGSGGPSGDGIGSGLPSPRPVKLEMDKTKPKTGISRVCPTLLANHYECVINRHKFPAFFHHYDVKINPVRLNGEIAVASGKKTEVKVPDRLLGIIFQEFLRSNSNVVRIMWFDNKCNAYTFERIEAQAFRASDVSIVDPEDPSKTRHFRVEIALAREDIPTQEIFEFLSSGTVEGRQVVAPMATQALEIAMRACPSTRLLRVGRLFYRPNRKLNVLGRPDDHLQIDIGHTQALVLGSENKITLNIDMTSKLFLKDDYPLLDYIMKIAIQEQLTSGNAETFLSKRNFESNKGAIARLSKALQGHKIKYNSNVVDMNGSRVGGSFFIRDFVNNDCTFEFPGGENGAPISVKNYLEGKYKNCKIKKPHWILISVGSRLNYLPIEMCTIAWQPYRRKLNGALQAKMIKQSVVNPKDRFQNIKESKEDCRFSECVILRQLGIAVDEKPLEIKDAVILSHPMMRVGKGMEKNITSSRSGEGSWRFGPRDQFVVGATATKIMIVNFSQDEIHPKNVALPFCENLVAKGTQLGMRISMNNIIPGVHSRRQLQDAKKTHGLDIVVIGIISQDGHEYAEIKLRGEVMYGILTACIKKDNFMKCAEGPDAQTLVNFLLKLNVKLGGVNFEVNLDDFQFKSIPTMILGADVAHPGPASTEGKDKEDGNGKSIAAVAASFNLSATKYCIDIKLQASGREEIDRLENIIGPMIEKFREETKKFPERIIMFRDGVSEGQFDAIKKIEYEAIRKAAGGMREKLGIPGTTKITFIVAKKRHHTRFQVATPSPSWNVSPGTLVETKIVHPTEVEFFLNSHNAIKGTAKPTRYRLIHDDSNFSMTALTRLTYFLCFGYQRCCSPVSIPSATYYAHQGAYHGKALLDAQRAGNSTESMEELQKKMSIQTELKERYPMYFI